MSIKVAIVDDKQFLRESLKDRLHGESDIEVLFQAVDGEDFLEKIKQATTLPNVVFMDIEMPRMDGIRTVTVAKELYPSVKFLMLTVFDEDDKLFEAIKAGAAGYLLKNESTVNIINAITDVEEGGAPMSPKMAKKALDMMRQATLPAKQDTGNTEDFGLSVREMELLKLLVEGLNYNQIAQKLFISPGTVRKHIQNIYNKLHVNSKTSAVKIAIKRGWFGGLVSVL